MMETFMREGCSTNAIADRLTSFDDFNRFVGMDELLAKERQFSL
jgi:methylisocitrate lyase